MSKILFFLIALGLAICVKAIISIAPWFQEATEKISHLYETILNALDRVETSIAYAKNAHETITELEKDKEVPTELLNRILVFYLKLVSINAATCSILNFVSTFHPSAFFNLDNLEGWAKKKIGSAVELLSNTDTYQLNEEAEKIIQDLKELP